MFIPWLGGCLIRTTSRILVFINMLENKKRFKRLNVTLINNFNYFTKWGHAICRPPPQHSHGVHCLLVLPHYYYSVALSTYRFSKKNKIVCFCFNYHSSLRLFRKGHTWLFSLEELDESVNTPEPLESVGMLWDDVRDSLREHKKRHECFQHKALQSVLILGSINALQWSWRRHRGRYIIFRCKWT